MNFGKISTDDLRVFLEISDEFDDEFIEAQKLFLIGEELFFAEDCPKPTWAHLYEHPILSHAALGLDFLGGNELVKKLSASKSQVLCMKEALDEFNKELDGMELSAEEAHDFRKNLAAIFAYSYSLYLSFKSLKVYGLYLNDLVAIVRNREKRSEKALLSAVKIDPTVLAAPSVNAYVSQQALLGNSAFFSRLKRAFGGALTTREQRNYQQMRLVLQVLKEVGANKLGAKDLYQLFVSELKLAVPDRAGDKGDALDNLRQFAYQFLKQKAVS